MALPFVGVGLFYRHGYFRQTIDADGHQEHAYPDLTRSRLPLQRVARPRRRPADVSVELPGRTRPVAVWLAQVGRVPLLLLDTDIPDNDEADRPITHILYVRGREMRLHQELVLGVGGVRALRALGIEPAAWHLNEGHSAFLLVERARELVAQGASLEEALQRVRTQLGVHDPHAGLGGQRALRRRPGPAGSPRRSWRQRPAWTSSGSSSWVAGVGRRPGPVRHDRLLAAPRDGANAVSQLHAETANPTWHDFAGQPILGITNGVHPPYLARRADAASCSSELGADLDHSTTSDPRHRFWDRIERISDEQLWDAHTEQKLELALFARGRLRDQLARHGESPASARGADARRSTRRS